MAISRLIEERVGLAEGMEDVRKWLIIISAAYSASLIHMHALPTVHLSCSCFPVQASCVRWCSKR